MSMTVYHGEPNGPSFTVLAALFETGLDAALVHIDLAKGQRHNLACAQQPEVAMSVEGEGPVVVVDEEGMTDSVFIACYLDDVGKGGTLRPADPLARWEMMTWCRQLIERTAPAAAYLGLIARPPKGDAAMLAKIGSADLRARWREAAAGLNAEDRLADSKTKIAQAVNKIEARLEGREWLMGEFSIADLESYAWLAGMVELVPFAFADRPRTAGWMRRVRARPAVAKALSLAREPAPGACWAPGPEINRWG
jgi:GSH-dependent disulfide-bond oxidoreductase